MPEFKTFSFSNVNVIFGILEIQGFADGDDVVTIEFEADQFNDMAGAKGDVVRSQTNDNRCTATIKLLQNSGSNKDLTIVYNADRDLGTGVSPLVVEDKETGETYVINNAWIRKYPNVIRGQNVNTMEWVFRGDFLLPVIV
ncbi:MAG: DUF3277 domain-containing protein [Deltaproteobacteria bacterium]|nr:MAG: DUF3277 domain-containing protein [Deltaproteobacteria bacterium]